MFGSAMHDQRAENFRNFVVMMFSHKNLRSVVSEDAGFLREVRNDAFLKKILKLS